MAIPTEAPTLPERVARVLTEEIAPAIRMDGGDIELVDVAGGVVRVRLSAVCNGCPNTTMAVIMDIEEELRRRVPEIDYIELVV